MCSMLLSYCNLMWQLEQVHQVPGTIINLPKQGDLSDPTNYRGITLLSVLYKLYTSVLNRRLINFAEGRASQQQQQQRTQQQHQEQEEQEQATRTVQPPQEQQQQQTSNQSLPRPARQLPQQQQSSITWRQTVTSILTGQLHAANIPTIVPACVRRTNQTAVQLAKACQRAFAAVGQLCRKLSNQRRTYQQHQQQRVQQQQLPPVPVHQQHPVHSQPQQQQQIQETQQPQRQQCLLHESQNGFRPQRSCAEHQFVLSHI